MGASLSEADGRRVRGRVVPRLGGSQDTIAEVNCDEPVRNGPVALLRKNRQFAAYAALLRLHNITDPSVHSDCFDTHRAHRLQVLLHDPTVRPYTDWLESLAMSNS